MNKRITIAIVLALALAIPAAAQSPGIDLNNLNWSVQYMIDQSQTVLGISQFSAPRDNRGLAISPDGRYLYAGYNNGPEVRKIDLTKADYTDATVARTIVSRGKAIAVDDQGRVYLAEGGAIKILDANLSAVQYTITGVGLVTKCEGVAVRREGSTLALYATERGGPNTLTRWELTESGGAITGATKAGLDGDGVITVAGASDMRGVAVDSSGRIWIADPSGTTGNGKVFRLNSDGTGLVSNAAVPNPYAIAFDGNQVLVTGGYQRVISALNMDDLTLVKTLTPPWAVLELDPIGQGPGMLSGIVMVSNGFYVTNEGGQTAGEKSTYGRTDAESGTLGGKFYTDLTHDDNEPILFASNPPPANPNATITIHVHTGAAPGTGQANYRVHVYNPGGGEVTWKDTGGDGNAAFLLNNGNYEYSVEKNGSYSARQSFLVAGANKTINHRLSVVALTIGDHADPMGVHQGYRVHVYRAADGGGGEWAWQDSDASGLTTFYMVDGSYSYEVEKNGSYSAAKNFDVVYSNDYALVFNLSKVTVTIGDHADPMGVHQGYRVHVYRAADGGGGEWAWQDSDASGLTTFYMVDGSYSYKVEKNGSYSAAKNFGVVYSNDYDLEFLLSKVTVTIGDHATPTMGVYPGYRVHIYRAADGGGGEWAWQDSDASGLTTFYMVDGSYSYKVEKNGSYSAAKNFDVVYSNDYDLEFLLSKVTIKVTNKIGQVLQSYRVHVYRSSGGGGGEWAWQDTNAQGLTTFYMVDGSYSYKVEKGCYWSTATDFTVVYSSDYNLTAKATASISIHITDNAGGNHQGYRVYLYNAGNPNWFAYQDSAANGMATFELDALTNYEYMVSWGINSAKVSFSTCGNATLDYKLSKTAVTVAGAGSATYRVYVYPAGNPNWFTYQDVKAGATATWYLVDGSYEYMVSWGINSVKVPFTVTRSVAGSVVTCGDLSLTYNLAKVDVNVPGGGTATYRVYVYPAGNANWFTYQDVKAGATATWYLVDGSYEYMVSWGINSVKVPFTVTPSVAGPVVTCSNLSLTYNLAKVDVNVPGAGSATYRVYVYPAGNANWFTYQDVKAGATATWYLVDGSYEYMVSWGINSAKVSFTVTPNVAEPVVTCGNLAMTYNLARITVKVVNNANQPQQGFRVYLYPASNPNWFTYQDTPASGEVAFYLVDGGYNYRVIRNCYDSGVVGFTVRPPFSPNPIPDSQSLIHKATVKVTIKVSDNLSVGHSGYLARVYKTGGAELANQWSNGGGLTSFTLDAFGSYEYLVEKNGARSARKPIATQLCGATSLEYKLAKITIVVSDNAGGPHNGYLVRVYNGLNGSGSEWGNAWSNSGAGETVFYLPEGNYGYRIDKNGATSIKYGFTVAAPSSGANDQTPTYKLAKITINVGQPGYLVRVFNGAGGGGSEWGNAWSNSSGDTTFYLVEGSYGYRVDKNGATSDKYGFTVTAGTDQTLTYTLARITINVGQPGYLVRVFNSTDGTGSEWGNAWSNGSGETTFYLVEGDYGYRVDKNGATSDKYGLTVIAGTDQTLTYTLAKITINVGQPGYLVRVFNGTDGTGSEWGNAWSNGSGDTTFYLVEGDYGYRVDKNGTTSGKTGFTVAPPASPADDKTLIYELAKITINVGQPGYLVRVFNGTGGSGSQWGNAWSNGSGDTTFYLVEGSYGYRVDKNGATSGKTGFTVAAGVDQNLTYTLAKITINVGQPSYLVRVFNGTGGGGSEWGNAWSNGSGDTTFYLVEGSYGYRVDKNGATSGKYGFTVAAGTDQTLTYTLAKITVHVQKGSDSPLSGYLVRIYNNGASTSQWGNAWTNGSGDAAFYLIEGGYQYQVEKNGYNSGKQPAGGFTVSAPPPANDQTYTHTVP